MYTANPKKLNNGDWGAWVNSDLVRPGDDIQVTTRGGKTWVDRVKRVLWSGKGGAIVTVEPRELPSFSNDSTTLGRKPPSNWQHQGSCMGPGYEGFFDEEDM